MKRRRPRRAAFLLAGCTGRPYVPRSGRQLARFASLYPDPAHPNAPPDPVELVERVCPYCGVAFLTSPRPNRTRRFCSDSHKRKHAWMLYQHRAALRGDEP